MKRTVPWLLLGLLALAAALRLWGIDWGLPHAGRFYPYHPDEAVLLAVTGRVNPLLGDVTPGFYNYGTFYLFLCRLAYDFAAAFLGWGAVPRAEAFPLWVDDFARLLLTGRLVAVALGVGLVAATYRLGRVLWGAPAGGWAAAFLAAAPMPVLLGHYMAVDVPMTFFIVLALLFAAEALRAEEARRRLLLLAAAGAAAGLATGTKYNAFPALFAVAVPLWVHAGAPAGGEWRRLDNLRAFTRRITPGALAAGLAFAVAFLVATPGALLEPALFWRDVRYELSLSQEGMGLLFRELPPAPLYHLGVSLPVALEWPLFLLTLAGAAYSLRRRQPEDLLLWAFALPTFLLLAGSERVFLRYVLPLLPLLLLWAGRLVAESQVGPGRAAWSAAAGAALLAALASSTAHLRVLTAPDARDEAAAFLHARAQPEEIVALGGDPWYYTPPIHPATGSVKVALPYGGPPPWDAFAPGERPEVFPLGPFQVLAPGSLPPEGPLPMERLERHRPAWVMLTDFEDEDPLRIRAADPDFRHGTLELLAALERDYVLEREFRPRPALAGFTWWARGIPPHDWRYPMPTVRIYRAR